jgi:hypothetical protein
LRTLSKVGSASLDAVCGSDGSRYSRGNERCVPVSLWLCRVKEISTGVLVASTKLVLSLTNAEADGWEHCIGPSDEIRCSCLKTSLQGGIEDAPVDDWHD